jgi:signal peptidase I
MAPTLLAGDHFFLAKSPGRIERGDVVAFKYPLDPDVEYVKRVVAVGGDHIEFFENGTVSVNGHVLPQEPSNERCPEHEGEVPCRVVVETNGERRYSVLLMTELHRAAPSFDVPPGQVYVVADNRDNGNDSRVWGALPLANITGKVLFIWWSRTPEDDLRRDRIGRQVR